MSEPHLPHDHSDGAMLRLQESVETAGSFQTVADIFKLLSDSSRVRIFWLLCHCEECVVDLSATVGMSPPAVSHHLRQLRESGLLISRRVGKRGLLPRRGDGAGAAAAPHDRAYDGDLVS